MKKITSAFLAAMIAIQLTGCSQAASGSKPAASSPGQIESESAQTNLSELNEEINGEITVSSYQSMSYESFLKEAAEKFEKKYPGTKVNIDSLQKMPEIKTMEKDGVSLAVATIEEDPQAESDYIFKVSNDIMSGAGADIYAMDILPYLKYAKGGYLEDLAPYMENDPEFNFSEYKKNVIDAVKYNGKQLIMPLDYSFNLFTYNKDIIPEGKEALFPNKDLFSLSDIINTGKQELDNGSYATEDEVKILNFEKTQLFRTLFEDSYKRFVNHENNTADFNSQSFINLLQSVQEISDSGYINEDYFSGNAHQDITFEQIQVMMSKPYLFSFDGSYSLLRFIADNKPEIFYNSISSTSENSELLGIKTNEDQNVEGTYFHLLGMNANSKNKQTAWAFIKFLLSEEMQNSNNIFSTPVHNGARAEKARLEVLGELYDSPEQRTNQELTEEQKAVYDEYLSLLEAYSDMINAYTPIDTKIWQIVQDECEPYFKGNKTAEQVAEAIQGRVNLYMNE